MADLSACPFCGTVMHDHGHCFSHPQPAEGDCILRHYSFDKQKAKAWNTRHQSIAPYVEALRELADAARSACDARQHTPLIDALAEADRLLSQQETSRG